MNHPWTTGLQLAYGTEAALWGAFIEQHAAEFPDKIRVASLVANSDFGRAYDGAFKAYIDQSPVSRTRSSTPPRSSSSRPPR